MNAMDEETMEIIEKLGNQLNSEENKGLLTKLIEKFNNWSFLSFLDNCLLDTHHSFILSNTFSSLVGNEVFMQLPPTN